MQFMKYTFHAFTCVSVPVSALGVYDEDSQWMIQVNRLQKLIDRLEQKVFLLNCPSSFFCLHLSPLHPWHLSLNYSIVNSLTISTNSLINTYPRSNTYTYVYGKQRLHTTNVLNVACSLWNRILQEGYIGEYRIGCIKLKLKLIVNYNNKIIIIIGHVSEIIENHNTNSQELKHAICASIKYVLVCVLVLPFSLKVYLIRIQQIQLYG